MRVIAAILILVIFCACSVTESTKDEDTTPMNAQDYYLRGVKKWKEGGREDAYADLDSAIQLDSTFKLVFETRAEWKVSVYDHPGAIEDLSKAIALEPTNYKNVLRRGIICKEYGYHELAIEDFNQLINKRVDLSTTYKLRARSKHKIDDFLGAIIDFDQAIRLDSLNDTLFYERGKSFFYLNDYKKAVRDFDKSLQAFTYRNERAYYFRGATKEGLKDYAGAIKDFNTAIKIDTNNYDSYYDRGRVKYILEDFRGAITDFTVAIKLRPSSKEAHYNRALSNFYLKRLDDACQDWSTAGELGVQDAYVKIKQYCQ